jgi:hypothetical protein
VFADALFFYVFRAVFPAVGGFSVRSRLIFLSFQSFVDVSVLRGDIRRFKRGGESKKASGRLSRGKFGAPELCGKRL